MSKESAIRHPHPSIIRVLLIEDNPGDARLVWEMLKEAGTARFELVHAKQLDEGLRRLSQEAFDILLLDLNLPDSQGLETLHRAYQRASEVPIVVLTVLDDVASAVQAVQKGAQNYLVKEQVASDQLVRSMYHAIERKQVEEQITSMALHDTLTGLPNRQLLHDRLELELARAYRNHQKLALMMLNLDHFKKVNDTFGHSVGNELLRAVGERLRGLVRKSDTVARVGSDEFMLILTDLAVVEGAARVAQRIQEAFRTPFVCEGHKLQITSSMGIAIYPYDGEDGDRLIKNADIAMYRAKEAGGDEIQRYTPAPNDVALFTTLNPHEDDY